MRKHNRIKCNNTVCIAAIAFVLLSAITIASVYNRQSAATQPMPPKEEKLKGIWIATVSNIDFPSKANLTNEQLCSELDEIIKNVKSAGLNTIFFQVRPCSDALYKSTIFPVSKYLQTGSDKEINFDALDYIIEKAHKENIKIHAWINPYRVTYSEGDGIDSVSAFSPAKNDTELTVEYNSRLYFNPGVPKVREIVTDGVKEILDNYDVDGIVFDDYFYPYGITRSNEMVYDDSAAYEKYGKNYDTIGDFRRASVNQLIKQVGECVDKYEGVAFGVSPFGIWANKSGMENGSDTKGTQSYFYLYADSLLWANEGYVDYIAPQIYWSMDYSIASYKVLCDWWNQSITNENTKLYICHALYKIKNDKDEAWQDENQINLQLEYAKSKENYDGSVFYGYKNIEYLQP